MNNNSAKKNNLMESSGFENIITYETPQRRDTTFVD
jgi:hypothetical protein